MKFFLFKSPIEVKAHTRRGKKKLVFVHPYTRTSATQAMQIARKKKPLSDYDLEYLLHHYDTAIKKLGYFTARRYGLESWQEDAAQDIRTGILNAHRAIAEGTQHKRPHIDWWAHYLNRGLGWANEKLKQVRSILSTDNKRKDFEDFSRIRRLQNEFQQAMHSEADIDYISEHLKMSPQRVQALQDVYSRTISSGKTIEGEEGATPLVNLVSTGDEPDTAYERQQLNDELEKEIKQVLNRREYEIFQWGFNHDGEFKGFFGGGSPSALTGDKKTVYEMRQQGKPLVDIAKHIGRSYRETYEIYQAMKKKSGVYDVQKNTTTMDNVKAQQAFDRIVAKLAANKRIIELKESYMEKSFDSPNKLILVLTPTMAEPLFKTHVKMYTRQTRTGKVVTVKEHEDKRTVKPKESAMWGRKKGDPEWKEELLSTQPERFEEVKKQAGKEGWAHFRTATMDMTQKPDFAGTVRGSGKTTDDAEKSARDTIKKSLVGFQGVTFNEFVEKPVQKLGDKYLLSGKTSGYNVMKYEVSPQKGFAEALFSAKPIIMHSMYNTNPEHSYAVLEKYKKEFGSIPTFRFYKKASSVLWATGKNDHIKDKEIRGQDWGFDDGIKFYDIDNNMLPIENEEGYKKHLDKIVFGRSCEYVMGFIPKDKKEGEQISAFLEKFVHNRGEKDQDMIPGSWQVPDFRSTFKVDGFQPAIANKKIVGNQELMILSQEKKLKGFETKKIYCSDSLKNILMKSTDSILALFFGR